MSDGPWEEGPVTGTRAHRDVGPRRAETQVQTCAQTGDGAAVALRVFRPQGPPRLSPEWETGREARTASLWKQFGS